ncbi:glycoside hydrolase family 65 protein [Shewanella salipaludis]|uniref:Glycoside hydrolase family 65 protein n=1 Tax=Shewanella salipaludis TaxID=2723052 RepID=A0A972FRY0_9GAMM|nr:glycoside hydrolase family 65 protein [Shewanella salipaludis]NMH64616.1 glycoside hydrolase family 65 protein [Shewanella salipaludis]
MHSTIDPSCPDTGTLWRLSEDLRHRPNPRLSETLFSQANGYIGLRGTLEGLEESTPERCEGVYLNGVYSREPIPYGETAYGFATHNHKLLQVPSCKLIALQLHAGDYHSLEDSRELDMATGIVSRQQRLSHPQAGRLEITTERLVSLAHPELVCIKMRISATEGEHALSLLAGMDCIYGSSSDAADPRAGSLSIAATLALEDYCQDSDSISLYHRVVDSDFVVASACVDRLTTQATLEHEYCRQGERPANIHHLQLAEGQSLELVRFGFYHHDTSMAALKARQQEDISACLALSYEQHKQAHMACFSEFWQTAQLQIEGDSQTEQGLLFSLFHLFQSTGRNGTSAIAAKGLSGPGYDGHYFWDTEIYIIPCLTLLQPELAKQLLMYRFHTLNAARQRARELAIERGALYAWRTIGGEECSAYFPAGTAQYHINSAVAYAIKTYYQASDDWDFIQAHGAEMVLETARVWLALGHFDAGRDGQFCIDGVTGPDEYTALVNNNFYTNFMARKHLQFALSLVVEFIERAPQVWEQLRSRLALTPAELAEWRLAADKMFLPFDSRLQIHAQDDSFLAKKPWDLAGHPKEKLPLLLHYHPLVIYRHQVLKQADTVLAMYLADDEFSIEQKARDLAYYEPLTTHDSTLSSCIHSIEYAETGDLPKAYDYFQASARMDLDNLHGNSEYGVHTACMAGAWNSLVFGFLGLRMRDSGLHFHPQLPQHWRGIHIKLRYRQRLLSVSLQAGQISFELQSGEPLSFSCLHRGRLHNLSLSSAAPCRLELAH